VSRPYRSRRRAEQAASTRRLVIDAARRLFAQRGYAGTTIAAIAEVADVALPTVYASVGGKPAVLMALQERIDEDSAVPASLLAVRDTTDPLEVIQLAIDLTRRINERFGDIIAVWNAAAPSEPEAAAAMAEGLRRHRAGVALTAQRLSELNTLRPGISVDEAADTLGVLTLWRTWQSMVDDYGWSWDTAAAWIAGVARASLLAA
jgi:AcrR family transcriptional regulator